MRSRKHDCPVCAAKDQTIAALADQIDWMRMHAGTPLLGRAQSAIGPEVPMQVDRSMYYGEEEEELHELHEAGDIGDVELEKALAQVQALKNIEIHN